MFLMERQVNPIAGLTPDWSDLPLLAKGNGIEYTELLGLMLDSALKRRGVCNVTNTSREKTYISSMNSQLPECRL
jgi:hypothetical protein